MLAAALNILQLNFSVLAYSKTRIFSECLPLKEGIFSVLKQESCYPSILDMFLTFRKIHMWFNFFSLYCSVCSLTC